VLWDVVPTGPGQFRGRGEDGPHQRIFGGHVAAQALASALADLPHGWATASLHARFVSQGRGDQPTDYVVTPVGERHRQVTAAQDGRTILTLDVAFRFASTASAPVPDGFVPAGWVPTDEDAAAWISQIDRRVPYDIRFDGRPASVAGRRGERSGGHRFWLRTTSPLPDSSGQHECALTYISDLLQVSTALARHGLAHSRPGVRAASLDHAVWFHPPFRVDEWLLYEQEVLTTDGGRGLCSGRLSDRNGRLVASVRQEVLIRCRVPA
jgi:acyl-CoA thioesterase-2